MIPSTLKFTIVVGALLGGVLWVLAQGLPSCRHCNYQLDSQPNCTGAGSGCALVHYSDPGVCNSVSGALSDDTAGPEKYGQYPMTTETEELITCTMNGTCVVDSSGRLYCSYTPGFTCVTSTVPRMALQLCR